VAPLSGSTAAAVKVALPLLAMVVGWPTLVMWGGVLTPNPPPPSGQGSSGTVTPVSRPAVTVTLVLAPLKIRPVVSASGSAGSVSVS